MQRQEVGLVYDLLEPQQLSLGIVGQSMIPHISSTTTRDRLPVAVIFSPLVSAARRSRSSEFAVTADPEISALARSDSRRIARLLSEGSCRCAFRLLNSSIVQGGSTPFSDRRTLGFSRNPGATMRGLIPTRRWSYRIGSVPHRFRSRPHWQSPSRPGFRRVEVSH